MRLRYFCKIFGTIPAFSHAYNTITINFALLSNAMAYRRYQPSLYYLWALCCLFLGSMPFGLQAQVSVLDGSGDPYLSIPDVNSLCFGTAQVLQANYTGPATVAEYRWFKDGNTTPVFIGMTLTLNFGNPNDGGEYQVKLFDAGNNEIESSSIYFFERRAQPLITSSNGSPTIGCANPSVTLTATQTGFSAQYQWQEEIAGTWTNIGGATSQNYTTSANGRYRVRVLYLFGNPPSCTIFSEAVDVTTVTMPPPAFTVSGIDGSSFICSGGTLNLISNISPNSATSYQWYENSASPGNEVIGATDPTSFIVNTPGTYILQARNACGTQQSSITVTTGNAPASSIIQAFSIGSNTACAGSPAILRAIGPGGANPVRYDFYKDGILVRAVINKDTIHVFEGGSYRVIAKNKCGEAAISGPIVVTIITPPTEVSISSNPISPTLGCGTSSVLLTATHNGMPAGSFQTFWVELSDTGTPLGTGPTYSVNTPGSYFALIGNGAGCSPILVSTDTILINPVTMAPVEVPVIGAAPPLVCGGERVLTVSTTESGSFKWYKNGVLLTHGISRRFTATESGSYTVQTVNTCGEGPLSAAIEIYVGPVNPPTSLSIQSSPTPFIGCSQSSVVLRPQTDGTPANYFVYEWFLDGNPIGTGDSLVAVVPGDYTVRIPANACNTALLSGVYTLNPISSPPAGLVLTAPAPASCGAAILLSATATGVGVGFEWYRNDTLVLQGLTDNLLADQSGVYKVRAYNLCGFTAFSQEVSVGVSSNPTLPTTVRVQPLTPPSLGCSQSSVTLSVATDGNPPALFTYTWYQVGNPTALGTGLRLDVSNVGAYYCVVSSALCELSAFNSDTLQVVAVTTPPGNVVSISSPTNLVCGSSITISAQVVGEGLLYEWFRDGQRFALGLNPTLTTNTSGTYRLQVSNACGISALSNDLQLIISSEVLFAPSISIEGPSTTCAGGTIRLQANSTNSGTTFRWFRNDQLIQGANTATLDVTQSGRYVVEESNSSCSVLSASRTITINPIAPVLLSYSGNTNFCEGDSLTILARSADNSLRYVWEAEGQSLGEGPTVTVRNPGAYNVILRAINNCGGESRQEIPIVVTPRVAPELIQFGNLLRSSEPAAAYQWRYNGVPILGENSVELVATASGRYSVVLTYPFGCTSISPEIFVSLEGEGSEVLRVWPNPSTGPFQVSLLQAGDYRLRISDLQGKTVLEQTMPRLSLSLSQAAINLSRSPSGIYIIQVWNEERRWSKRVIIR